MNVENKITKGIKGEHLALRTFLLNGFDIVDIKNLTHIDYVIEKYNEHYKIQVKSWFEGRPKFRLTNKRNKLNFIEKNFDVVFFTNLKDFWIIPYEYLKRKPIVVGISIKKINCFKNNINIITMKEKEIMGLLMDNKLIN